MSGDGNENYANILSRSQSFEEDRAKENDRLGKMDYDKIKVKGGPRWEDISEKEREIHRKAAEDKRLKRVFEDRG